jgi:cytoskeleton protein RodZ
MESIGEKLRTTREEKTYSVEQVARDTNIAKRYLIALEDEEFDVFPGDPYLIGFLRNYAEYLDLDPNEMVNLYKNFKIQEQPVPLEELIVKKDRGPLIRTLALIIVIAAVIGLGVFLYPRVAGWIQARGEAVANEPLVRERYTFQGEFFEKRFVEGDVIVVPGDGGTLELRLAVVEADLTLETPAGMVVITLGEEKLLDVDGDAEDDFKVFLRDIDNSENAVVLRLDKYLKATIPVGGDADAEGAPADRIVEEGSVETPSVGNPDVVTRLVESLPITRAAEPEPFSLDMVFRGYCLVRYIVDNELREERYFHKAETFRLDVRREVMLWISNAGSFTTRIAGEEVNMGRPGEVTAKLVKWVPDDQAGGYVLTAEPVY